MSPDGDDNECWRFTTSSADVPFWSAQPALCFIGSAPMQSPDQPLQNEAEVMPIQSKKQGGTHPTCLPCCAASSIFSRLKKNQMFCGFWLRGQVST
ncbi:hypothetical protein CEP88_06270 [Roseobacter denitrificans]|nr:hypothetical protein CEP88_06270 [Roseobacter denitrificans]